MRCSIDGAVAVVYKPHNGFLAQVKMAGSEPLFQEADPHITKLALLLTEPPRSGVSPILVGYQTRGKAYHKRRKYENINRRFSRSRQLGGLVTVS